MGSGGTARLSALLQGASLDDHEEILKSAEQQLKRDKGDVDVLHVKVIALTRLDRYEEALQTLEKGGDTLKKRAKLEWAYALYKFGHLDEARKVASEAGQSQGLKHVEAQAAYRGEDFAKAAELYQDMSAGHGASTSDLRINSGATDAQLGWAGQLHLMRKTKSDREDLEQFETAFNSACAATARGELKQAEVYLKMARDLCKATDELSEAEKEAELLPITVQQVFVSRQLGKGADAEKLLAGVNIPDISDPATRHIAQSNSLMSSANQSNPYLAHRRFQSTASMPSQDRPFKFQSSVLNRNSLTLELLAQKQAGVKESTLHRISREPGASISADVTSAGVSNAAAEAQNRTGKEALKQILPLLDKRPNDVGLLLTIVQLYVLTDNISTATTLLESFFLRLEGSTSTDDQDVRFAPGLVALIVSLYSQQGRTAHTKAELAKAAKHWRHKSKGGLSSELLKAAAAILLEGGKPEEIEAAGEMFDAVLSYNPQDQAAAAGLVASAHGGDASLKKHADALPTLAKLTAGIDVNALEEAGVVQPPQRPTANVAKKRPATSALQAPSKKRKLKKSRMPKEYDANKKLDPERWLPLRDRSNWRPKGKKKSRAAGMMTQGGIVSEDSRPATPNQPQQQPVAGGAKNKKKNRKK